jgi:ribosomal-protein-serine acetyltransferase
MLVPTIPHPVRFRTKPGDGRQGGAHAGAVTAPSLTARPAETLVAGELRVRRYRPWDAAALHDAITDSVEWLRPWMPWIAQEPLTVSERRRHIRTGFDAEWDDGTSFVYGVFAGDTVVGGCGLHPRIGPGGLEIGYWVRRGHTGRGIATAVAGALVEAAFALDHVTHVEIHHDRANVASGRVPARLGFTLLGEVPDEITAPGETGVSCEWRLGRATSRQRRFSDS